MSKKEIADLLGKARRSIKAAERLLRRDDYGFAVLKVHCFISGEKRKDARCSESMNR